MNSTSSNLTSFSSAAWSRLSQSTPIDVELSQLSLSTEHIPKRSSAPDEPTMKLDVLTADELAPLYIRQQFMEAAQRAKATLDEESARKRRSPLGSESPRRIVEIKTITLEEVDNPKASDRFENLLQSVVEEAVLLKEYVGKALPFEWNNYGITADSGTTISVIAESLTITTDNDKDKQVVSGLDIPLTVNPKTKVQVYKGTIKLQVNNVEKTYKVHSALIYKNQVFSADATAILADAVNVIPYKTGCQSFILADGCGFGQMAKNASLMAVDIAMETLKRSLGELKVKKSTTRDIARVHVTVMNNVQQALTHAGMLNVGATTLTIATVALPYLVVTRLGDCDVFVSRRSTSGNRQCFCVTPGSRKQSLDAKDPGGSLGYDMARWQNYSVSVVKLEASDRIMGFTDGVTDNFDPAMHGETPRTYSYEDDTWDNTKPALFELRQSRLAHRLAKVIQPDDRQQTVEAIISFISNTTLPIKEHILLTGKKPPEGNYKEFPGKEDHASGFILDITSDLKKSNGSFLKRK